MNQINLAIVFNQSDEEEEEENELCWYFHPLFTADGLFNLGKFSKNMIFFPSA